VATKPPSTAVTTGFSIQLRACVLFVHPGCLCVEFQVQAEGCSGNKPV
jgi:hypothetical protein